jgi:hypothetical protein
MATVGECDLILIPWPFHMLYLFIRYYNGPGRTCLPSSPLHLGRNGGEKGDASSIFHGMERPHLDNNYIFTLD